MVSTFIPAIFTFLVVRQIGVDSACHSCGNVEQAPQGFHSVLYSPSEEHLENPGRGFYRMLETKSSNFIPLNVHHLDTLRNRAGINVCLRIYILDSFVNSPISSSFLNHIRNDMQIARDAGWTLALRFHYTNIPRSHAPYGDATKSIILEHIRQLAPIWREYEGVISVIQAGFIGTWGEWYYTTYFGHHPYTDRNWEDRREVLMAIINHSPSTIPIQVRTPEYKMHICGTSRPATLSDVNHNNCVGRTGHHNDCFLASDSDVGTYRNPAVEKPYLARDTLCLPVSGETCGRSVDSNNHRTTRSDCPTALRELAEFHWSILHDEYHPDVLSDWKNQGCFSEIHKRLGYRLSLKKVILPNTVDAGGNLCYHVVLENTGFAAPHKPWKVALVLKSQSSNHYFAANLENTGVRTWLPGSDHVFSGAVRLPSSVQRGTYDVYLAICDEKMKHYSNYYVLLANTGVPHHSAGLNSLRTTISVSGLHSVASSCPPIAAWNPPTHGRYSRVFGSGMATPQNKCVKVNVPDHSFENHEKTSWKDYHGGYTFVTSESQEGSSSIRVTNGGADQLFEFNPPIKQFVMTGYSKVTGTAHSDPENYSMYCDIQKPDGSHIWGKFAAFQQGNSDWRKATLKVHINEGIKAARCYLLYRNFAGGAAYFDNINMWTVPDSVNPETCNI